MDPDKSMASEERSPSTSSQWPADYGPAVELLTRKSAPAAKTPAESKSDSFPNYKIGTETILLVEDEEHLRTVLSETIELLGYNLLTAKSGEDALTISANCKHDIHLLLTDVRLPEIKGPELALRIQTDRPQIKVIYISGYPKEVLAPDGVLEPGTVLLHKPFTIKVLAATLREVLDH